MARTWDQVRATLDPRQVDEFNERLKREWAIETGIIERLYTLDRGTTQQLIKHANLRVHHEWVRLAFDTEDGRSEILTSLHAIGREFRGLIGVSMCFYRRQPETPDEYADDYDHSRERMQVVELEPVCDEVFHVNHMEEPESVQRRFQPWMERALVLALDQWRRGEQLPNHNSAAPHPG